MISKFCWTINMSQKEIQDVHWNDGFCLRSVTVSLSNTPGPIWEDPATVPAACDLNMSNVFVYPEKWDDYLSRLRLDLQTEEGPEVSW